MRSAQNKPGEATRLLATPVSTNTSISRNNNNNNKFKVQPVLIRHDSEFSVGTAYSVGTDDIPRLNVWQGAALLTADCLGTGLLALPADIHVLGAGLGVGFLLANLPINLYAGTIFHMTATWIEQRQTAENRIYQQNVVGGTITPWTKTRISTTMAAAKDQEQAKQQQQDDDDDVDYREVNQNTFNSVLSALTYNEASSDELLDDFDVDIINDNDDNNKVEDYRTMNQGTLNSALSLQTAGTTHTKLHHDTATFDFVGITQALFRNRMATRWVLIVYYTNIFLVLGNYILVMSHSVAAVIGEDRICIPLAGLLASTGMFLVSQFRSMARLGKTASILSLSALFIVVLQCLWSLQDEKYREQRTNASPPTEEATSSSSSGFSSLRKLAAFGSIGFAVGSQKLFLNIRHELSDRNVAPRSLAIALTVFGTFYVLIVIVAGPNPPGFLFDAIPQGWNRRIAGLLLWVHVIVSYSINSQAICSSMDRLVFHRLQWLPATNDPAMRWLMLTALMAISAYTVANAIPFFTDLVSLIGALTSVPLTLMLPAIFYRKHISVPLWLPTSDSLWSISLTYFSVLFMVTATAGSLYSIQQDWGMHGPPFSCH